MAVKQEEKISKAVGLLTCVFGILLVNGLVKIHFVLGACIMMLLLIGWIVLGYRKQLRTKQKGESLSINLSGLGFPVSMMLMYIIMTILTLMDCNKSV